MPRILALLCLVAAPLAAAASVLPKGATLLESRQGSHHTEVGVYEKNGERALYTKTSNGLVVESLMRMGEPAALDGPYLQVMALVAGLRNPGPSIFNWGMGGGSLPRFYFAHDPTARITSVEIDLPLLELARKYFDVERAGHEIIAGDAIAWLRATDKRFDVIWQDAWLPPEAPGGSRATVKDVWVDLVANVYPARLKPDGSAVLWCGPVKLDRVKFMAKAARAHFKRVLFFAPGKGTAHYVLAVGNDERLSCSAIRALYGDWVKRGWVKRVLDVDSKTFCRDESAL